MFTLRTYPQIYAQMVSRVIAETPLDDLIPGSVFSTFLEAAALEDDEQYFQMLQIINNYSLDSTTGTDLDKRAAEYDVYRLSSKKASTYVSIVDKAFSKVQTGIYSGQQAPRSGQNYIYADSSTGFPSTGQIIVGRGKTTVEKKTYASITNMGTYVRFNITGNLFYDHGTDEKLILAQGGDRMVPAGLTVTALATDKFPQIDFLITADSVLLDGENLIENVPVEATTAGAESNVPARSITKFQNPPFATADLYNPAQVTNGSDQQTDQELRDTIKLKIQSLSKGVKKAILSEVLNTKSKSDSKRVISAALIEAVGFDDLSIVYIDDGTGIIFSISGNAYKNLIASATGGEQYLRLPESTTPLVKAYVETNVESPWDFSGGSKELVISVGDVIETATFSTADFLNPAYATPQEVVDVINRTLMNVQARISSAGTKIRLFAKSYFREMIQVTGGTANNILSFPTDLRRTLYMYLTRLGTTRLLSKDGITASIECSNDETYSLSGTEILTITVDGKSANTQTITFQSTDFAVPGFATAEEVVTRINLELAGATAYVSSGGTRVTITSNLESSYLSSIQITGGSANATLQFPTTVRRGSSLDYSLNRFSGEIKLTEPLKLYDRIDVGLQESRLSVATSSSETYSLSGTETLTISVDGNTAQSMTFLVTDFVVPGSATAAEVALAINSSILGVYAYVYGTRVAIRSNTIEGGTIQVTGGTANLVLNFPTILVSNFESHQCSVINEIDGPYQFGDNESLVIVVDSNTANSIVIDFGSFPTDGFNKQNPVISQVDMQISPAPINEVFTLTFPDRFGTALASGSNGQDGDFLSQFKDLTYNSFSVADVGKYIYISGSTFNDGVYKIDAFVSSSKVNITPDLSNTETGMSWILIEDIITGKWFKAFDKDGSVAIWYDCDAQGTVEPSHGCTRSIKVDTVYGLATDLDVAAATSLKFTSDIKFNSLDNLDGTITVTLADGGAVSDAVNGTMPTPFSVAINTQGVDSQYEISGHRYLLTLNSGPVHIDWDGAAEGDLVEFNDSTKLWEVSFDCSVDINGAVYDTFLGLYYKQDSTSTWTLLKKSALEVVLWLNTPTNTSLNAFAYVELSNNGQRIQLSSKTLGASGRIQVPGGTANNLLQFPTYEIKGVDAYSYYTGLAQEVQWKIDGKPSDSVNYPGVKASGVQIEVSEPVVKTIKLSINLEPTENTTIAAIEENVKSAIGTYINNLPVGGDVILASIIAACKSVSGVYDAQIISPLANVTIADYEKPRVDNSNILIS